MTERKRRTQALHINVGETMPASEYEARLDLASDYLKIKQPARAEIEAIEATYELLRRNVNDKCANLFKKLVGL